MPGHLGRGIKRIFETTRTANDGRPVAWLCRAFPPAVTVRPAALFHLHQMVAVDSTAEFRFNNQESVGFRTTLLRESRFGPFLHNISSH